MLRRLMIAMMLAHVCASTGLAADPAITVSAKQRYPWNGLVDLHFTITGDSGVKYDTSFTAKDMVGGTNITMATVRKADGTAANMAQERLLPGTYRWVWDAASDLPKDWKCDRVTVTGKTEYKPLYMVVDLSGGSSASSYPVSYLDAVPSGGWSDTYKTTKLVLRRIEPGTFKMQGTYNVTLTKPFYIGVFEVTQKQFLLVNKTSANIYKSGDAHPVDMIQYNEGFSSSASAYTGIYGSRQILGKLRTRTGLYFDLPSEAQWEYACRAGTTSSYNNGGSSENDLKKLGRYYGNRSDGKGGSSYYHTKVGSYLPNAWGLYDMHGNVFEWCLDWWGDYPTSSVTDPKGASTGSYRVMRGGCLNRDADRCRSASRLDDSPDDYFIDRGFRVALTPVE